jgi:hypothetical protein
VTSYITPPHSVDCAATVNQQLRTLQTSVRDALKLTPAQANAELRAEVNKLRSKRERTCRVLLLALRLAQWRLRSRTHSSSPRAATRISSSSSTQRRHCSNRLHWWRRCNKVYDWYTVKCTMTVSAELDELKRARAVDSNVVAQANTAELVSTVSHSARMV